MDLYGERAMVRDAVKRNTYTGKTYNSLDHISQFFAARGIATPPGGQRPAAAPQSGATQPPPERTVAPSPPKPARKPGGIRPGATVVHPKYGRGTVMRREGEGEDAKLTISFPGHGLKKLVAKFAGLITGQ